MKAATEIEKSGFVLTEDALGVLTSTPLPALGAYYLGTVPFLAGLITYWAAMSSSAVAHRYHAVGALGVALLFVWMKAWHCRFMQGQLAYLQQRPAPRWTLPQVVRIASRQCLLQVTGFFTLPIAIALLMPMPWAYGFYQHASVLDDGAPGGLSPLVRNSLAQAGRAPKQCLVAVWLLCPLPLIFTAAIGLAIAPMAFNITQESPTGMMSLILLIYGGMFSVLLVALCPFPFAVLANVVTSFILVSQLIYSLFGIQHAFIVSDAGYNELFFASAFAIAYLLVDPLAKTAFVLRTFDGESRNSGIDLQLTLRRLRQSAAPLLVLLVLLSAPLAGAAPAAGSGEAISEASVTAAGLDQALDRELAESIYLWRMERIENEEEPTLLQACVHYTRDVVGDVFTWLKEGIEDLFDWLFGGRELGAPVSADSVLFMGRLIKLLLLVLCVVLFGIVMVLLTRALMDASRRHTVAADATSVALPDITDETTTADALPEEGWLALAQELLEQGERRLALRAYFLALLATLARREYIQLGRAKSNLDYLQELRRRAQGMSEITTGFQYSTRMYEASWYGDHPVSDPGLQAMRAMQEALSRHG